MRRKQVNDKLSDDDILSEVRYQSSQASGSEFAADELTSDRQNALKAYLGKPIGNEVDGNSTVQSLDVADMIDAMLTQIMPTFSKSDLVQFEAVSEQDDDQARTESNFCNYIIMEKNKGFILFETLVKDALLSKNATAKVRVDIKEDVEKERYKGLTEDELYAVLQPTKNNQEVITSKFDKKKGIVNLKRITTKRKLIVEAVAPENFSVTAEHKSPYLDECTYCVERYWSTKSNLIEEGYDPNMVMELPVSTADTKADSIERNQIDDEQNFFNTSPSMQIVELEEHYIRIDQDGDGVAELHKVVTCENNLLSNEEVDCVPYANGVAWLMGHRFYGLSAYDKLKNVQSSKTHFLRQMEDNAVAGNHQKTRVIEDQVNMDDFLNGRHNALQRVESMESAMDVPFHDTTPSMILAMDYWDKVRTERSGSSLDLQANSMTMPSNVGDQGVSTLIANLEKVTALITSNLCETLVYSTYRIVHKFLRLYFHEEISSKIGGQWGTTNPSQWLERDQVNIIVPPTNSEKIQQQIALEKLLVQSSAEMQQGKGGITTDETQIYQIKLDYMRMSGIDHPEKYFINPNSPESQQAAQQSQQMQQMEMQKAEQKQDMVMMAQYGLQKRQVDNQQAEVMRNYEADKEELAQLYDASFKDYSFKYDELQRKSETDGVELQRKQDEYLSDVQFKFEQLYKDLQFKYDDLEKKLESETYKTNLNAEISEAKIIGDATTKIELEDMKARNIPEPVEVERDEISPDEVDTKIASAIEKASTNVMGAIESEKNARMEDRRQADIMNELKELNKEEKESEHETKPKKKVIKITYDNMGKPDGAIVDERESDQETGDIKFTHDKYGNPNGAVVD